MLLFLLLLFPLSLISYYLYKKEPRLILVIAIGFLTSLIVCAVNFFFKFSHRIVPYSFWLNCVYYAEKLGILPITIVFGVFLLVTRDDFKSKIDFYIPLFLSYYMVLIPYNVISTTESNIYTSFDIFIKPLIYLALVFGSSCLLKQIYFCIKNKKIFFAVLSVLIFIVDLLFSSIIEAMFAIGNSFFIILILSAFYLLANAFLMAKDLKKSFLQKITTN